MIQIHIISLFPEMFSSLQFGVPRIAQEKNKLRLHILNPRDFTSDPHRTVDDKPYGGGPGMVMKVEPIRKAILQAKMQQGEPGYVIYASPQGKQLDHNLLKQLISRPKIIFIAGRYEGIDERLIEHDIDEEISIGDYVLSGGEYAVMVMIDALSRLIPGVIGDELSSQEDSFATGLLDYPHYTRPECIDGQSVPQELLTGHHHNIAKWRRKQALGKTWLKRPDLLKRYPLSQEDKELLMQFKNEFNCGDHLL